ncbi:MAG: hypothetical protein DWH91_18880 [Planctomycetota bacterium]|nr:MAG: hypothetical protein DWH91_18880 [Planctomycetota bacterium]
MILPLAMDVSGMLPPEWVVTGLAMCRLSGMVLACPFAGAGVIPWRARLAMALVIAWPLAATVPAHPQVTLTGGSVLGELLSGVLLGLGMRFVLTALRSAGNWIDEQTSTGLTAEPVLDTPADADMQGTAQLLVWIGSWLLLTMTLGAEGPWIESLRASFIALPLGTLSSTDQWVSLMVGWMRAGSLLALGIALPICLMQILLQGALAMFSRSWGIPLGQAISPIRAALALILLGALLPRNAERVEAELDRLLRPSLMAVSGEQSP